MEKWPDAQPPDPQTTNDHILVCCAPTEPVKPISLCVEQTNKELGLQNPNQLCYMQKKNELKKGMRTKNLLTIQAKRELT